MLSSLLTGRSLLARHKKAIAIAYFVNLLTAAFLLVPFASEFTQSLWDGLPDLSVGDDTEAPPGYESITITPDTNDAALQVFRTANHAA